MPGRAVASRVMGETALLLHPRADEVKLCNETGTLVWRLVCEGSHDADSIAVEVARVFEVELGTARSDVDAFLAELEREGFLDWQELPKAP